MSWQHYVNWCYFMKLQMIGYKYWKLVCNITNFYHKTLWGGGYISLSPGTYNFTFEVETSNTSSDNIFIQYIWWTSGLQNLAHITITGKSFKSSYVWANFTITLKLSKYYSTIQFPAFYDNWNGTLVLHGITIRQTSESIHNSVNAVWEITCTKNQSGVIMVFIGRGG